MIILKDCAYAPYFYGIEVVASWLKKQSLSKSLMLITSVYKTVSEKRKERERETDRQTDRKNLEEKESRGGELRIK